MPTMWKGWSFGKCVCVDPLARDVARVRMLLKRVGTDVRVGTCRRSAESVDIEIDSGAEVSCLPANIGADTYPLDETRLSMCGGHHVAAGGGKLHEVGARILGFEAENV